MVEPVVSIIIPTLNSEKVLSDCLLSISKQTYPKKKVQLIVADGGSTDTTLKIARKFGARIVNNPLKTGEAGKSAALSFAKGELIAFVDSDNILPENTWLMRMVRPFGDPVITLSEPIEYTYRREGGSIERYSAMMGMNDPLCLFLGNYDRINLLTGKWTAVSHKVDDRGDYLKITITDRGIPTIGANGTIFRASLLKRFQNEKFLFDIDVIADEITENGSVSIAKVKTGIIHTFCESSILKFYRKQTRRILDYLYFRDIGTRSYNWQNNRMGLLLFILSCITVVPLLFQMVQGFIKKK